MSLIKLDEAFLAKISGWQVVKHARALLETEKVLSSNWTPPILKGVVQEGGISYRAGLVIRSGSDLENMCTCRESRSWGTICSHSIAVGLHHLRREQLEKNPVKPPAATLSSNAEKPAAQPYSAQPSSKNQPPSAILKRAGAGQTGESLELAVILPPNLPQALAKGLVMVCIEGITKRGRKPLNALEKHISYALNSEDTQLLNHLETIARGEIPAMIQLRADAFAELLGALVEHPRLTLGRNQPIKVEKKPFIPPLKATLETNGEIVLALKASGGQSGSPITIGQAKPWIYHLNTFRPLGAASRFSELHKGPVRISRAQIPLFMAQDWPALANSGNLDANFKLEDFSFVPTPPRFELTLSGGISQLQALLQCAYGQRILPLGAFKSAESLWIPDPKNPTMYSTRDYNAEQAAVARLMRAGFSGPDDQCRFSLSGQTVVLNFLARDYPRIQRDWSVTLDSRLDQSLSRNIERVEPSLEITSSGEQWFDLHVDYSTGSGEKLAAAEIQRLLLSGQSHRRLANGKFALIDSGAVEEFQEVLRDCSPEQHAAGYRISSIQSGFLAATIQGHAGWKIKAPEQWRQRSGLMTGAPVECPPIGQKLEQLLRPYQKTGVAWLHFLHQNQFGGILADDMGLGKTVQMLAFMQWLYRHSQDPLAPSIIVCPTSLVHNWVSEAQKYTPDLKVLALHGADRAQAFPRIVEHHVIVTSYALLRRDAEVYQNMRFTLAVLDEAQHIKNRQTQNAQAVKGIRADNRFVLTGTPMENSVLDLWSIFDFLMPGYLGSAKDFRERYELPIAREKDAATQIRLSRRIRPFVMRRLKKDVVKDLPEKIEQISYCDLTPSQAELYTQVLDAGRREITEAVGANGLGKSRILIFTTLLRLRQICCDLRLLKLENPKTDEPSGKLELFEELMEEVVDGGHRVLVFSQFTTLLELIKESLDREQIGYCYLDGSTVNRAEVVERFQKQEDIPVFLLSLKAGGVGLNLTGADTVIHLDPWWNPAVEDQATDRAHRIGQQRVVTSYKLITRGTVEEKILNLQQRKREMLKGALGDEETLSNLLSWEEIQELMS